MNKRTSAHMFLQHVKRWDMSSTEQLNYKWGVVFHYPGKPCHLLSASEVFCAGLPTQRVPRWTRTCQHPGGQSLHQQRSGPDDQPASAPQSRRPRLLAGRQLLHRQQPHGGGEAQPIRLGRNAEPEATGGESEQLAEPVWARLPDSGEGPDQARSVGILIWSVNINTWHVRLV